MSRASKTLGTIERRTDKFVDVAASGDWREVERLLKEGQPINMLHSVSSVC
jgi:hypothetical protein